MDKTEKLKPCPFCGNEKPVMMTRRGQNGWRDYFYVLCDYNDGGCGASGQWNHYTDLAAEAWNKRTVLTPEQVLKVITVHGHHDKQFSWGEKIRYTPTEIYNILEEFLLKEDGEEQT